MHFIVLLYSTSMPLLYLAGFTICFSVYWSDKYMFISYYRTPPRLGIELMKSTGKVMEIAIILHLLFGCYMITNPDIFNWQEDVGMMEWAK